MSDFTQRPFAGRPPQYAHDDVNPYPREMRVGSRPQRDDERRQGGAFDDMRDVHDARGAGREHRPDFGAGGGFSPAYREEHPGRGSAAPQAHEERQWRQGGPAPRERGGFHPYEVAEGYQPQGRRMSPDIGQYDPYRDEFRPMGGGESAGVVQGGLQNAPSYGPPPRYLGETPYRPQSRPPQGGAGRWTQWARHAPEPREFGKSPKNYRRSDDRICEDISERIMREPAIDASDVEIDVQDQEVTLKGSVPDRWMKRCIDECAHDAMLVDHVENRIRIQPDSAGDGAQLPQRGASKASSSQRRDGR